VLFPVSLHVLHRSSKLYDEFFDYNIIYIFTHISAKFHSEGLQDERDIIVFLVLAVPAVSAALHLYLVVLFPIVH
jgi:predicted metallopeptidase